MSVILIFVAGKLEKFHVKQDVNPIPLDSTTHNSSETPKILGPHCGNKNLKKCLYCLKKKCLYCQATGELDDKILSQTVKSSNKNLASLDFL